MNSSISFTRWLWIVLFSSFWLLTHINYSTVWTIESSSVVVSSVRNAAYRQRITLTTVEFQTNLFFLKNLLLLRNGKYILPLNSEKNVLVSIHVLRFSRTNLSVHSICHDSIIRLAVINSVGYLIYSSRPAFTFS